MIALAMVYVAAVGGLCAAAAVCAERAALLARRPARVAWVVALVGSAILPAALLWSPRPRAADGSSLAALLDLLAAAGAGTPGSAGGPIVPGRVGGAAGSLGALDRPLGVLWAILAAVALAHLTVRAGRTRRALADAARRPGARVRAVRRARVLVAAALGPAALGGQQPAIVLPHWTRADPDAERRRLVFAHEAEHVRAGDPWLLGAATAFVALAPWSPAAWWILARLRAAVELDCDARVLARTARPGTPRHGATARYGTLLLDVAARPMAAYHRPTLNPAFAGSTPTTLERRLRQMTAPHPPNARARALAFASGAALCAAVACELPRPTGPVSDARLSPAAVASGHVAGSLQPPMELTLDRVRSILGAATLNTLRASTGRSRVIYLVYDNTGAAEPRRVTLADAGDRVVPATLAIPPEQVAAVVVRKFPPGTLAGDSASVVAINVDTTRRVPTRGDVASRAGQRDATEFAAQGVTSDTSPVRHPPSRATESSAPDSILVVIDGHVAGHGMTAAKAISPDSILTVDVLKGRLATTRYGADGRNGVVVITTKRSGG